MALYGGGITYNSCALGTSIVVADLKASPISGSCLLEISSFIPSNSSSSNAPYALARASAELLQLAPSLLQPYDPADKPILTALAMQWSVSPAVPTNMLRRAMIIGATGTGVIWSFPRGLRMMASSSLVLCYTGAQGANLPNLLNVEVDE